jgi:hypothetical protein
MLKTINDYTKSTDLISYTKKFSFRNTIEIFCFLSKLYKYFH